MDLNPQVMFDLNLLREYKCLTSIHPSIYPCFGVYL